MTTELQNLDLDRPLKHEALRDALKRAIESGELKEEEKIASQNEMCRLYGVSHHTVREAVSSLVSEGYLSRSQGKGAFVNKLKTRRMVIGTMLPHGREMVSVNQPLGYDVIAAYVYYLEDELRRTDASMMLFLAQDDPQIEVENVNHLMGHGVDGIIAYQTGSLEGQQELKQASDSGIPVVLIDRHSDRYEFDYVVTDNYEGSCDMIKELVSRGCRKVGYYANLNFPNTTADTRFQAYNDTLTELGMLDESIIYRYIENREQGASDDVISNIKSFLQTPDCGLFFDSMLQANEVFQLLGENFKPGNRVYLAAFDEGILDVNFDHLLVQALQPLSELAAASVKILTSKIAGDMQKYEIKLKPRLRIVSTEPPSGSANLFN